MRLLYAEDERAMSEAVVDILTYHKYSVDAVYDGEDALAYAQSGCYDGIILDVMMPKMSGLEVLRRLRREGCRTPILLLTAKGEVEDRIEGLDSGADDYLPKPFNPRELLSRIRAVMRRAQPAEPRAGGELRLDDGAMKALKGGEEISLSGQEYRVLKALLASPGQVLSRDALSRAVFGRDAVPMERGLDMQISRVRRKLGAYPDGTERIRSIRGAGYMYVIHREGQA